MPLLDWTLENLALAEVEEIFILASRHSDQIKKHLATTPARYSLPKITVIATPDAQSLGDVMRELDSKQIIRSDFILIHADSVASMDLASIVDAHKRRRKKDKDAIMTICTMPVGKRSRIRTPGNLSLFFLEPTPPSSSTTLPYAQHPASAPPACLSKSSTKMPPPPPIVSHAQPRSTFATTSSIAASTSAPPTSHRSSPKTSTIRPSVATLSSASSPPIFSIARSLSTSRPPVPRFCGPDRQLLFPRGCRHLHVWPWLCRARQSPADYDAISKDVMGQWTYPLGPAGYLPGGQRYSPRSGLRFLGDNVVLSRTCQLGPHTLVGSQSEIGDKASLHQSVLGSSVKVGSRTTISGSYVWTGSVIGSGCSIERSIVGERVTILDGVKLNKGCIISGGCTVGPNVDLPAFSRVGNKKERSDDDFDSDSEDDEQLDTARTGASASNVAKEAYSKDLGAKGVGFLWRALGEKPVRAEDDMDSEASDEDEDDVDEIERSHNLRLMRLGADLEDMELDDTLSDISSVGIGRDSDDDDDDDGSGAQTDNSMSDDDDDAMLGGSMMLSIGDGETNVEKQAAVKRLDEFRTEATASLERAFEENHTVDDAAIELKTLRMASNVPLKEVRKTVIGFILTKCEPDQPKQMLAVLDKWCPLISVVACGRRSDRGACHRAELLRHAAQVLQDLHSAAQEVLQRRHHLRREHRWLVEEPLSRNTDADIGGDKNLQLRKGRRSHSIHPREPGEHRRGRR